MAKDTDDLIRNAGDAAQRLHIALADPLTAWLENEEEAGLDVPATMLGAIKALGSALALVHLDCGGMEGPRERLEAVFDMHARMLKLCFIDGVETLVGMAEAEEAKNDGRKPS